MKVRELIIRWGFEIDDKPLRQLERNIAGVKSIARTTVIAIGAISAGVGVLLRQAGKFEQWEIAFETMLGSTKEARKLLEDVKEFTLLTPFQLPQVIEGTKRLLAFGIETEKIIPTLKALGDVSAGLGVDIGRMILNFGQVKAQAKLTGRELRDFAIMGVPLLAELAKMLNVAQSEIQEMVSRGEIGFEVVEQAFISMTTEGGRFNNLMLKQMKSLFGIWSNIVDMIIQMAISIGNKLLPKAKQLTKEFLNYLTVNKKIIEQKAYNVIKILISYVDRVIKFIKILSVSLIGIIKLFGGFEKVIKFVTYALLSLLAIRILATFGSIIQVVALTIMSFKKLGNAALLAQAKIVIIPILIGAAFVALGLILEDIVAYFQGRKSITELIIKNFRKLPPYIQGIIILFRPFIPLLRDIKNFFEGKDSITGKIVEFVKGSIKFIDSLINKILLLVDTFKKFISIFEIGKSPIVEAFKNLILGSLPELIVSPPKLLQADVGAVAGKPSLINNISLNNKIDVNVPPETAPELIGEKIKEGTSEAIQKLVKDTDRMIEDRGE